jgi:DNA polymerase III epsilon subunit-like protein
VTGIDGLFPKRLRLLFYDIETAPMLSFHWEPKTDYIPAPMVESDDRFVLCWSAKWSDGEQVQAGRLTQKETRGQDDARIVTSLADLMREADYVVAHNGNRFDYKRVNARLLVDRLTPLGSVQMIDTLSIARTSFDLPYNSLNYLAEKLGFGKKLATSFELWRRAFYGDVSALKEMEAYNRQDVILLEHVFHAIAPYAKTLPRLVDATEWRQELCPYCGSRERVKSKVPHRTKVNTYPKFTCTGCQRQYRGWQAIGSKKAGSIGL